MSPLSPDIERFFEKLFPGEGLIFVRRFFLDLLARFGKGWGGASLAKILIVYTRVLHGDNRRDAVSVVSRSWDPHPITPQSVADAITRALGKNTEEIDRLMRPANKEEFKNLLKRRFPRYEDLIDQFFSQTFLQ